MKKIIRIISITLAGVILFSGCTKKNDSNDAAKFVGTWNGTATCSGTPAGAATITFSAAGGNSVTVPGTVGGGACQRSLTFTLTASGNTLAGSGSYPDACGNTITMSISGSLSGSTLTFTLSGSGTGSSGTCVFTGTK